MSVPTSWWEDLQGNVVERIRVTGSVTATKGTLPITVTLTLIINGQEVGITKTITINQLNAPQSFDDMIYTLPPPEPSKFTDGQQVTFRVKVKGTASNQYGTYTAESNEIQITLVARVPAPPEIEITITPA